MSISKKLETIYYNGQPDGIRSIRRHLSKITTYVIPRPLLSEAKKISGITRPGIYYLINENDENKIAQIYIGQTRNGVARLDDHTIIFKGDDNCYYEKYSDGSVKNIQDEIPFDLPVGWAWSRLKTLSASIQYGVNDSAKTSGSHRLLRITDIQNWSVNWNTVPYTTVNDTNPISINYTDTNAHKFLLLYFFSTTANYIIPYFVIFFKPFEQYTARSPKQMFQTSLLSFRRYLIEFL